LRTITVLRACGYRHIEQPQTVLYPFTGIAWIFCSQGVYYKKECISRFRAVPAAPGASESYWQILRVKLL